MRDVWRRLVGRLRRADALPCTALLWAGTLAGLGRGLAWPWLPLAGLFLMFYAVRRARSRWEGALWGVSFGLGEAGVCFFGSVSWGAQVPLVLTLLCVASHHLPLALWARWAPGALRLRWLWIGTIGFSATSNALAELLGIPSREAVVLVTTLPELVGGARLFGADLITAIIEAGLLISAHAAASATASSKLEVLRRAARPAGLALLLLAGSSGLASATSAPATGSLLVGVPQINADATYYKSRLLAPRLADAFDRQFSQLNQSLRRAQLVVTTEGFDGRFGLMLPAVRDAWAARARSQSQAWLLTSYIAKADGRKSNAAGAFTSDGVFVGVHEKVDLAPFGEPDLAAGTEYRPLPIAPGVALGVLICQESYLQHGSLRLARAGATLLATTTSDVTFGSSTTVIEHLAMAQLRAIEAGRAMIWASNAGPSGVIDRRGRFEGGPFRTPFAMTANAHLYADLTPFHRFAPFWLWLGPALLLIALITVRRGAAVASLEPLSFGPQKGPWRAALVAVCSSLAVATTLGASAAVEARWGMPARAWSAIPDLLASPTTIREPNAYEKFWRPAARSAEGAIAYLLEYYGLDRDESPALQSLPDAPSLEVVANFLESHYGLTSRRVRLDGELPLTPMLLRSAQGHFAVVDYAGSGHGGLIDFASGQSRVIAAAELAKLAGVEALFPYSQP